jgi:ABC-type multidrug transport system ATPase subunit
MSEEVPARPRSVQSLIGLFSGIDDAFDGFADITPDDPIRLSWIDIRHRVKPSKPGLWSRLFRPAVYKKWKLNEGKEILHGVLGEIEPGQIVAMMGGTGAGKSTMLNILAGRLSWGEASGLVRANGRARNPTNWRRLASYVEQKDELDPTLTVEEVLRFFTFIKLPDKKYDRTIKEKKVQKLLKTLELESVADHQVTTLSDGQRKLLSIGIELAGERRIIFLDEPTTGLDSVTSMDIVMMLKKLTIKYDLSIVMTIHQPRSEILEIFDRILLLAQGSTIYYGDLDDILQHLIEFTGTPIPAHENPADYSNSAVR